LSFQEPGGEASVNGVGGDAVEPLDEAAYTSGHALEQSQSECRILPDRFVKHVTADDETSGSTGGNGGGGIVGAVEESDVAKGATNAFGVDDMLAPVTGTHHPDLAFENDEEVTRLRAGAPENPGRFVGSGSRAAGQNADGVVVEAPEQVQSREHTSIDHRM
jgi:hypothetical protein